MLHEPLAYQLPAACRVAGVSRSTLYRAAARGELTLRKLGRVTLVDAAELRRWLAELPAVELHRADAGRAA